MEVSPLFNGGRTAAESDGSAGQTLLRMAGSSSAAHDEIAVLNQLTSNNGAADNPSSRITSVAHYARLGSHFVVRSPNNTAILANRQRPMNRLSCPMDFPHPDIDHLLHHAIFVNIFRNSNERHNNRWPIIEDATAVHTESFMP
jgi:hypothetical protein